MEADRKKKQIHRGFREMLIMPKTGTTAVPTHVIVRYTIDTNM